MSNTMARPSSAPVDAFMLDAGVDATSSEDLAPVPTHSRNTRNAAFHKKRKRLAAVHPSPLTPPLSATSVSNSEDDIVPDRTTPPLSLALRVISAEAAAVAHISNLYATSEDAQASLLRAVDILTAVNLAGGRLVFCGVGKSGLVAQKTVATMKSLGLGATFLHAGEALHGDLGDIRPANDAVLFVSYSGATAELLAILPHIPSSVPVLALTGHTDATQCPLFFGRSTGVLLPATIPVSEEESIGVKAPTASTTVAMAVGDMLAMALAEKVHGHHSEIENVFKRNHPGGAIGAASRVEEKIEVKRTRRKKVCFEDPADDADDDLK